MVTKTTSINASESAVADTKGSGDALSANNGSTIIKAQNIVVSLKQVDGLKRLMPDSLSEAERETLARRYLDYLADRYTYVQFKGMGINNLPLKISLLDLYVPLKARLHMPEGDCWTEELRLAGRKASKEEMEAIGERIGTPKPLLELLNTTSCLVVLGDPGSGKTTFLKYLVLSLAIGSELSKALRGYFPILLPLSDYADRLGSTPDLSLEQFFNDYYRAEFNGDPLGVLVVSVLDSGKGLVLLDGLDEVKDETVRGKVADRVAGFYAVQHKTGNRFVMTSRIVGYQEVRPTAKGLAECTLVDFDGDDIELFLKAWTDLVEQAAQGQGESASYSAQQECNELLESIEGNERIKHLAANPLLLTILALMKRQGVELPKYRVKLYQNYLDSLLTDWHKARSLKGQALSVPEGDQLLKVLWPLALWMQEQAPGKGLVKQGALLEWLRQHFDKPGVDDAEAKAKAFIEDVRLYSGLLLDRGGCQFGFIHLTFMEYLAGVAIARKFQTGGITAVLDVLSSHINKPDWHEVILLGIGHLAINLQLDELVSSLLEMLLQQAPGETGQAALIVGEALVDIGHVGVSSECWAQGQQALLNAMRDATVAPIRRMACAEVLAKIDDPRPEVMSLDVMAFCRVPAGRFFMGSSPSDSDAMGREVEGAGDYSMAYDYFMARYPVTVAQFQQYLNASGVTPKDPDCTKGAANTPVVRINWYEAMAFCDWLSECWWAKGVLPEGYRVSLPSEPEWEKAARGGYEVVAQPAVGRLMSVLEKVEPIKPNLLPQRRYPWSNEFIEEYLNSFRSGWMRCSGVGAFPQGASPYGCEEMSGNVWEWMRSVYGDYPYATGGESLSARESLEEDRSRVLRGGAFSFNSRFVRAASRLNARPESRSGYIGFRVVVSPFTLTDECSDSLLFFRSSCVRVVG